MRFDLGLCMILLHVRSDLVRGGSSGTFHLFPYTEDGYRNKLNYKLDTLFGLIENYTQTQSMMLLLPPYSKSQLQVMGFIHLHIEQLNLTLNLSIY